MSSVEKLIGECALGKNAGNLFARKRHVRVISLGMINVNGDFFFRETAEA